MAWYTQLAQLALRRSARDTKHQRQIMSKYLRCHYPRTKAIMHEVVASTQMRLAAYGAGTPESHKKQFRSSLVVVIGCRLLAGMNVMYSGTSACKHTFSYEAA